MNRTTGLPTVYDKPLPVIEPGTQPFWDALRKHELIYQRCRSCDQQFAPYQPVCPSCWSEDLEDCKSSGRGRIYTFSIVYRAPMPAFRPDTPYVVAIVELEEGVFLTTNIVGCPVDRVEIGMLVEVEYIDATEAITLPKFKPRS
jgi:uncharacterized OB-fold protein